MRSSETVFAGTVVSSVPAWQHGSIFTTVRFSRLSLIKGPASDTLQLVLEGGRVGTDAVVVDGQPEFEVGDRYIVFALLKAWRVGLPVIACFQVRAGPDGRAKVFNEYGGEATHVSAQRFTFVLAGSKRSPPPIPKSVGAIPPALRDSLIAQWKRLEEAREDDAIRLVDYENGEARLTEEQFLAALTALIAIPADSLSRTR